MKSNVCPTCLKSASNEDWNNATSETYGQNIAKIDDHFRDYAWFTCPNCGDEIFGGDLL